MPKFASGVVRFQKNVFPEKRELFERLSKGQEPEALFITCSDSRIQTAMITQTDPGEIFHCRNPGNIVPPHSDYTGATAASIEFAMAVLKIPHIVVCGHTGCAAMKAAMAPELVADHANISEWLGHTRAAVEVVKSVGSERTPEQREQLMLEQNVVLQMTHLKTHPSVAAAMAQDSVTLHGWVYDIKSGGVNVYDEERKEFVPVGEHYADAQSES